MKRRPDPDSRSNRKLRSHWFHDDDRVPQLFREFVVARLVPRLKLTGYKIPEKTDLAIRCLHKLIKADAILGVVADTRDTHKSGVEMRVRVWDAIVKAGLAEVRKGSEQSGFVTRYRATKELHRVRRTWELEVLEVTRLERNTMLDKDTRYALVVLKPGKVDPETGETLSEEDRQKPLSLKQAIRLCSECAPTPEARAKLFDQLMAQVQRTEDILESINAENLSHAWSVKVVDKRSGKTRTAPVNPCLRQVHVGHFDNFVRLYSCGEFGGQSYSKVERRTIRIDGRPVTELDFSGMATRMVYHAHGIDPNPEEDVYRPEQVFPTVYSFQNADKSVLRTFVKRVTNACWNVSSRKAAVSAVNNMLHNRKGKPSFTKCKRTYLLDCMGVEGIKAGDVVQRIQDAHPEIEPFFFAKLGDVLTTWDGEIMLDILQVLAERGFAALGLHDGVLCAADEATIVRRVMKTAYKLRLGFSPVIK